MILKIPTLFVLFLTAILSQQPVMMILPMFVITLVSSSYMTREVLFSEAEQSNIYKDTAYQERN